MLNRAEALARVRELAAAGEVVILPNPQRDLDNLGYDADDVCDCLEERELWDVDWDAPDEYRDGCRVLAFKRVDYLEDELYVKVSVPDDARGLILLSFKLWGSPR